MTLHAYTLSIQPAPERLRRLSLPYVDELFRDLWHELEARAQHRIGIHLSGELYEYLIEHKRQGFLRKLGELSHGRVNLTQSTFFSAHPSFLSESDLARQFELSKQKWDAFGATFAPIAILPSRLSDDRALSLPALQKAELILVNDAALQAHATEAAYRLPSGKTVCPVSVMELGTDLSNAPARHAGAEHCLNFILTVDITKTPHLPASKVIHALDTLLSKERVLSPLDLSAIPYADSIGPDLFLPKQQVSAAAQALQDTIFEFKHAFDAIPEMLVRGREAAREQNQPADVYGDTARLEAAGHFLMQAQGTPIDRALEPAVRAYTTDLLLRAEVEIDSFFHPSSDPTIGWIKREAAKDDTLRVVTQLSRFSLSHDGEITQFGFKPHKCDLLGVAVGLSASKSGSAALGRIEKNAFLVESPFSNSEPHKVTRETLDLIGLRYVLKSEGVDAALSKEFLFHSEIGAHLPNATTGFSLEYWVDSPKPLSQLLLLSFFVSLPSCDAHSAVGKPLLCVGGVSEGRLSLDAHNFIPTNAVPGGLFGMRIIDTLDDLFIDIRSSKQLNAASVEPVWQMPEKRHGYAGAKVMLGIDASRIRGDEKSATIFISVM